MFWGLFNQRGHSIFETILTVSIVGGGLFGGMSVMQNTTLVSQNGDMSTVGGELANESMESILADKEFMGYGIVAAENYPSEELAAPFSGFTRTVTVTEVSLSDLTTPQVGSGVKKVEVTVNWGNSDDEKVQLMTLLGDY
jgi:hypothetical protein